MALYFINKIESLHFLRASLIFFCCYFFFEYFYRISDEQSSNHLLTLNWANVDLESPPTLETVLEESIRFNELLAHIQYKCRNVRSYDNFANFQQCRDFFTSDSGDILLNFVPYWYENHHDLSLIGQFEKSAVVCAAAGTCPISSQKFAVFNSVKSVISSDFLVENLRNLVAKYDSTGENPTETLNEFMEHESFSAVKLLHITVRLANQTEKSKISIFLWYTLLNRLFYRHNFALYDARQSGLCGRVVENCRYDVSFLRFSTGAEFSTDFTAPVMGMGSPTEEYCRLVNFLQKPIKQGVNCAQLVELGSNFLCMDNFPEKCSILAFSLNSTEILPSDVQEKICREFVGFNPSKGNMNLHNAIAGIWPRDTVKVVPGPNGTMWKLEPLLEILEQKSIVQLSALVLNTYGMEMEFVSGLLQQEALLKRILQISFLFYVWYGEENENYIRFYSDFLRLENAGFKLRFSRQTFLSGCPRNAGCFSVIYSKI